MTGNQIAEIVRKPLAKIATRVIFYGLAALLGVIGIESASIETCAQSLGASVAAVGCVIVGGLIDRWHHKRDRADPPE